jgi:hypothetical protein
MQLEESFSSSVAVPIMAWQRFADLVGMDRGIIRGMCDRGYLPVKRIGRHRFVNLAQLTAECLSSLGED